MEKSAKLAAALVLCLLTDSAFAVQKYYISIGCYPDYKMHRIGCDVGTSWKTCAAAACDTIAPRDLGHSRRMKMAGSKVNTEPKLFGSPSSDKNEK